MGSKEAINEQRKSVVEQIVSDMQNHGFDWVCPWSSRMMQQNACSGHVYAGGNRLHLAYVSRQRGYDDPRWCTYHQVQERGWQVRKGAKSAAIEKRKLCRSKANNRDRTGGASLVGAPSSHTTVKVRPLTH